MKILKFQQKKLRAVDIKKWRLSSENFEEIQTDN